MGFVRTLIDCDQPRTKPTLPQLLRELYDGDLHFPADLIQRPYVIGNFVSTLDGVVSYRIEGSSGGSTISGSDPGDRFIMGLLRASVDAVMIGSRTVHEVSSKHLWIPSFVYPDAKELYRNCREALAKPRNPWTVIVSGSGRLDLTRSTFRTPEVRTIIITTPAGQAELAKEGAVEMGSVEVHALQPVGSSIDPLAILQFLRSQFGVQIVLHEGGPTLFSQFLAAEAVDELFLTLSPQIAGRTPHTIRPGIVQGVEFVPNTAPWFQLLSLRQRAEYLYLRYRRVGARP